MIIKEFAQKAIKNGYKINCCDGWDWIRENLKKLDYILKSNEFKNLPCYLSDRENFLCKNQNCTEEEKKVIHTVCYLDNQRKRERERQAYREKMISIGYLPLTKEIVKKAILIKKRLEVKAAMTNDWLTVSANKIYKPIEWKGSYYLMKPKARTKGFLLSRFDNAFCKLV